MVFFHRNELVRWKLDTEYGLLVSVKWANVRPVLTVGN